MTQVQNPEDTAAGHQALAGDFGERTRQGPMFRSQANAPRLPRPGRSYFR